MPPNPDDTAGAPIEELPTILAEDASHDEGESLPCPPGQPLDGRYTIREVRGGSGKSGMGVVYIVDDGEETLAVKTFQPRFARDLVLVQRFIREARTWMLLGFHPYIVRARRLDIVDAVPYLFMEYVPSDGHGRHALSEWIRQGPLPVERVLAFGIQICEAMAHATSAVPGLVHRDLKPENILIDPGGRVKITDFGLVRCGLEANALESLVRQQMPGAAPAGVTQAGAVFGTPAYMAPEQFEAASNVTKAADIYALGCCLFEMLTGEPPFLAKTGATIERIVDLKRKHARAKPPRVREHAPDCPPDIEGIVLHCLEKDPDHRWPDFESLGRALGDALARDLGERPAAVPELNIQPRDIGEQMRSLTLLEGYDQAIRMRHLRERHQASPYAFHLALASYFRHQGDQAEEERQLRKATRALDGEPGYEGARRLAELCLRQRRFDEAEAVLADFLAAKPEQAGEVLEPYLQLLLARERFEQARHLLDNQPATLKTHWLRAALLRHTGPADVHAELLGGLLEETLEELRQRIASVTPDDLLGWGQPGDAGLLRDVINELRPEWDTEILDVAEGAVWPDMRGYPDFAPAMAWLSEWLGGLARLNGAVPEPERQSCADCAALLDFPRRLRRHLERDEAMLWLQDHHHGSG